MVFRTRTEGITYLRAELENYKHTFDRDAYNPDEPAEWAATVSPCEPRHYAITDPFGNGVRIGEAANPGPGLKHSSGEENETPWDRSTSLNDMSCEQFENFVV